MPPTSSKPRPGGEPGSNGAEAHSEGAATTATRAPRADRLKRWVHFSTFRNIILDQATSSIAPIKAVVTELAECIGISDDELEGNKDYEALKNELERIFEILKSHYEKDVSPAITASMESLWKDTDREFQVMNSKREWRGGDGGNSNGREEVRIGKLKDAVDNLDDVLRCYGRVRDHLQRVLLNANLSIWKIVDEIATDNRLDRLRPAMSAFYNSAEASQVKRGPCTRHTRIHVLDKLATWVEASEPGSVYWMSGMAGTGKTTISYSLCQQLEQRGRLAASFFCTRVLSECRRVERIIPSIAYQLARFSHPFRFALSIVLVTDPDAHARLPSLQFEALIVKPLLNIHPKNISTTGHAGGDIGPENASVQDKSVTDTLPENLVVVIDALDECESKEDTRQLLKLLLSKSRSLPIKFVVSSRPEPEIRDPMIKQTDQGRSRVVLHELDQQSVQTDIESYLRETLAPMQPRPTEGQIAALVRRAGTLFISAATIARYISYNNFQANPHDRLTNVLTASGGTQKKHKDIDDLYTDVLRAALDDEELEPTEIEDRKQVLYTVICAKEPLTLDVLSKLLKMNHVDRVHAALRPLWSVLHVSSTSGLVTTFHASFPEYMLSPLRSKEYHCDPQVHNRTLALACFECFQNMRPQFNICRLESSFIPDYEVKGLKQRVKKLITTELFYAARYWTYHIDSATRSPELLHELEEFLSVRLLLWMEVMNLKNAKDLMQKAIETVEEYAMEYSDCLKALAFDAVRFVTACTSTYVSTSTLHIYMSVLSFWPISSPIAKLYVRRTQGMAKVTGTAIVRRQYAPIVTRHLGSYFIQSPTFSPDGTQLAVGVGQDIVLLNALTGWEICPPLNGHSDIVVSVRFSPDGSRIVSGSMDKTIRVWSTNTGESLLQLGSLAGHTHWVQSVAFSPDGSKIVSGSYNEPIRTWDANSGKLLSEWPTIPDDLIDVVKYSLHGRYVISLGRASGIVVWDTEDGRALKSLCQDETDRQIYAADISPDDTYIAYAHYDEGIYVWSIRTGQVKCLTHHTTSRSPCITSLSFSHDGSRIATGSEDNSVYVWDSQTGDLVLGPLVGHIAGPMSLAFSPGGSHLVSGSTDGALCLWDTRSIQTAPNLLHGHGNPINSIGVSYDGTRIVASSKDWRVCVWDAESGDLVVSLNMKTFIGVKRRTSERGYARIQRVAFSPDGTRIIVNTDHEPFVFDANTGSPCSLYADPILPIIIALLAPVALGVILGSPESKSKHGFVVFLLPFSLACQCALLLKVMGYATESLKLHFIGFQASVNRLHALISQVNQYLIMATRLDILRDAVIGPVGFHAPGIIWAEFSPDGTRIASCSSDGILRTHNAQTNRLIFATHLSNTGERGYQLEHLSFSSNGRYIFSKVKDRKPQMHDANSGQRLVDLSDSEWEDIKNCDTEFSPDGTRIVVKHRASISLIELTSRTRTKYLNTHLPREEDINAPMLVRFSVDGSHMASALTGGSTCIWDVQTAQLLVRLSKAQLGRVTALALLPDGGYLITGSDDGSIRITDVRNAQSSDQSSVPVDWEMNEDGWIIDNQSRPLICVPDELRPSLVWPRTKRIISKEGWLELDFKDVHLRKSWTQSDDST